MQWKDLPPLGFLPAFEAAARLGSFKAAAAELHVTPSAVSQQLKALEDALGVALFERRGRAIVLTHAGRSYLPEIQQALLEIASGSQRLRRRAEASVLRLSMADFIAYEFLLPRLSRFRARFPGLELSLEATARVVDFARSDVDGAIRIADGPWPGLVEHPLGDACIAPVCSPALAREIRSNAQLCQQTLIELRGQERRGWKAFMKKQGEREPLKLLSFEGYIETMRAAEQGLGVAFGVFPMTTEWVTSGRLAVPLPWRIPFLQKISFVHRVTDAQEALYRELTAWLRQQYAELPELPRGRLLKGSRQRAGQGGRAVELHAVAKTRAPRSRSV